MDVKLYSTTNTDLIAIDGAAIPLPSGYNTFTIKCEAITGNEASDIVKVWKQVHLAEGEYASENLLSAGDLLSALGTSLCMTKEAFEALPGMVAAGPTPLLEGVNVYEDTRDDILFPLRLAPGKPPILCCLRRKYYSASLDIALSLSGNGSLRRVCGILHTHVTLTTIDGDSIAEHGTPIYFRIPVNTLLVDFRIFHDALCRPGEGFQ
ncbi:MAG: hypothetical protein JW993_02240 [Sedimentisphaerales bacterium]|nr:hypothetical protein [Sedimentisphaerales bacterium]